MDPLTHTFLGAALADSGLKRRTALATATLVIGANLPDVDVLAYLGGSDNALHFRRGHTHGVLAWIVLPIALTVAMLAFDRLRRRLSRKDRPPAVSRELLLLSALAVWSHPALDWLNTYGVRLLMPFDGRWFYGDALYIVDPWVWLTLGGVLFWNHSRGLGGKLAWTLLAALASTLILGGPHAWARGLWFLGLAVLVALRWRRGTGDDGAVRRRTRRILAVAGLYAVGMVGLTAHAERTVARELDRAELAEVERFMVGPVAVDSFTREVILESPEEIRFGVVRLFRQPRFMLDPEKKARQPATTADRAAVDAAIDAAVGAPCVGGFVGWMRYPFFEVEESAGGVEVHLMDARYARRRSTGFGATEVHLDGDLGGDLGDPHCEPPPI